MREELQGLSIIADLLSSEFNLSINPIEVAYLVRNINIGEGCFNQCTHCFASPPKEIRLMNIDSFSVLTKEFGIAVRHKHQILPFIFLGSSTDPSMIANFASYAEIWIKSLPEWHPIKFYTHGWNLSSDVQYSEFSRFLNILKQFSSRITVIALSIDFFNINARLDKEKYINNIGHNLKEIRKCVPYNALKLVITYPIERLDVEDKYAIRYWRNLIEKQFIDDNIISDTLKSAMTPQEQLCAELTHSIFKIGQIAGFDKRATSLMARDNGAPIPIGNALSYYKNRTTSDKEKSLSFWKNRTLKSLVNFPHKYDGLVICTNGAIRLIDYGNYKFESWLNKGMPAIPYIVSSLRDYSLQETKNEYIIK